MDMHGPALLDFKNVSVMRGQKIVLENFSLRIRGDEHVAILGPNGCGKSTLIKTITRECYPLAQECSSMTILGQDRWDVFELRSLLGIVSNDLMSRCTGGACGRDVVLSGFFSSTRIFPHHAVEPRHRELADAAMAELQISHLGDRSVSEMSSGEARRVLIARALVHKPRALLFDEPSNSLDVFARLSLRENMSSLAKAGIGIILVTHDLSDLIPEIERV
ncbi:MAG TPA: ATP-binding cassette domain-containing protein, partial [Terriglobales bacterium]|nr:ATP-binding cassette domain-containing protein [Terriglobales bacterium]